MDYRSRLRSFGPAYLYLLPVILGLFSLLMSCRAETTPEPIPPSPTLAQFQPVTATLRPAFIETPATPATRPPMPNRQPTDALWPTLPASRTQQGISQTTRLSLGFHVAHGDGLHMAAARAAGGRFVMVVFSWADIEPTPGYVYWEIPDAALRAAEFYDLDVIARLDQPPTWALDETGSTPWQLDAYASFVSRVAARYGDRLGGVIIWNEPNLAIEWANHPPDATAYAEMLQVAYPAVKGVAPDLPVLLAGLAATEGEGDWAINDLDYLQALYEAGAKSYFDVLTGHPYGFGRPPNDPPAKYRPNFRRLELYREIMAAHGDQAKPVWITEMGWLTWATDPKHAWQVITPALQADYIQQALQYAERTYPWLERVALWQLDSDGDEYGYPLWHGPAQTTPAYETLIEQCEVYRPDCRWSPATIASNSSSPVKEIIPILAAEATIRLGDRDNLHPHWVHLYNSATAQSLIWQGEFFLTTEQAIKPFELIMETMQVSQSTNRVMINDREIGHLKPRSGPNPTSTWATQRFHIPAGVLQPGSNHLRLQAGLRNQLHHHGVRRWENFQTRHIRLAPPQVIPASIFGDWQPHPSPGGWREFSRLRPGLNHDFWLTDSRPGSLWHTGPAIDTGQITAINMAGDRPDLIFNDIVPTVEGLLAATNQGLFWRATGAETWMPLLDPPAVYAHMVLYRQGYFYAGFERAGMWVAERPAGPWRRDSLPAASVFDLTFEGERSYAVTAEGAFTRLGADDPWVIFPIPALAEESFDLAVEDPKEKRRVGLYPASAQNTTGLIVRSQDRLWTQEGSDWLMIGPDHLAGRIYSLLGCCRAGMLVGTNRAGIWELTPTGEWARRDGNTFDAVGVVDLLRYSEDNETLYAFSDLGLFYTDPASADATGDGQTWQQVTGFPSLVSDLLTDPADPTQWLAGTPVGVYRSQDQGQTWTAISPPWPVWEVAFGPSGRFFAASSVGLAWTDDVGAAAVTWQQAEGLEQVFFFNVEPHPAEANIIWAGTWGNNIGTSTDGGQTIAPIHNGLETLSVLDLIWHQTPGQITAATIEGIYRTDDGGSSWFRLPGPLTRQTIYSLLQTDDGAIWAGAANGLWVSRDYGVTWLQIKNIPAATILRFDTLSTPNGEKWLWAGTEGAGLWLSRDGGLTWDFGGLAGQSVYALFFAEVHTEAHSEAQPRRLVAATDQGIFTVGERITGE